MLGRHDDEQLPLFYCLPETPTSPFDEKLQAVSAVVDFEFVRELAAPHFSSIGRPSADPVVVVKMLLVGRLFGISSNRRLVAWCADSIAVHRFLGVPPDEDVPCHDTLCDWQNRVGPEFFETVLSEIVRQCEGHGMRLSGERVVDGTSVRARASRHGPTVEVPQDEPDAAGWLEGLEAGAHGEAEEGMSTRLVSRVDPEARFSKKRTDAIAAFYYQVSLCSDPETGLVVSTRVGAQELAGTLVEHLRGDPGEVESVAADGLYDEAEALAGAQELGVTCYVPERKTNGRHQIQRQAFRYDRERDEYVCPAGCRLPHKCYKPGKGEHQYRASSRDCRGCRLKGWCTTADYRTVSRMDYEWARERTVRWGPGYRLRQGWRRTAEHLNLLAKRDHGMGRASGIGLARMRCQAALTAVAIDVNKLLKFLSSPGPDPVRMVGEVGMGSGRSHEMGGAVCVRVLGAVVRWFGWLRLQVRSVRGGAMPA